MSKIYSIVGQKHRNLDAYLVGVLPGTSVTLVREPNNEYDRNAIAIWINDQKVGYIPMKQNAALAQFIDQTGTDWMINTSITFAADAALNEKTEIVKAISAVFVRSPKSGYPMVEI
ncbi:MAG: HIRAN domain-containing protein [Patescibacteria group bacterium]|nr:HIRAN domain-containing protein [Patescibacteria group bacterium]